MKKLILIIGILAAAASCKVIDPYDPNHFNEHNVSNFCSNLFDEEVKNNLTYFYNAYHIARFIEADAELKVSPEFDMIRTGLSYYDGIYRFDYDDYSFNSDILLGPGSSWKVSASRYLALVINAAAEKQWSVTCADNGTVLKVKLMEENPEMMRMIVSVKGIRTEESEFSAKFSAEDLEVTIRHQSAGKIESMEFRGEMNVTFYEGTKGHRTCVMTMAPDMETSFVIN